MSAAAAIRRAVPADLERLAALEQAAFADPWSGAQIAGEIDERHALVLVDAGLEAYAVFRHIAGEAELLRLAVAPPARRRGLGRRLAEEGLAQLRAAGCSACYLEVRTTNRPAIALYEGLDFRRAGTRREYYADGTDALIMHRSL
jgi:ribosomal-protein-alanine N-acetyltransferase